MGDTGLLPAPLASDAYLTIGVLREARIQPPQGALFPLLGVTRPSVTRGVFSCLGGEGRKTGGWQWRGGRLREQSTPSRQPGRFPPRGSGQLGQNRSPQGQPPNTRSA